MPDDIFFFRCDDYSMFRCGGGAAYVSALFPSAHIEKSFHPYIENYKTAASAHASTSKNRLIGKSKTTNAAAASDPSENSAPPKKHHAAKKKFAAHSSDVSADTSDVPADSSELSADTSELSAATSDLSALFFPWGGAYGKKKRQCRLSCKGKREVRRKHSYF